MNAFCLGLVESISGEIDEEFDGCVGVVFFVVGQNWFRLFSSVHHRLDHRLLVVLDDGRVKDN